MVVKVSREQTGAFRRRQSELQLKEAARDLHAKAHEDYSLAIIEKAILGVADRAGDYGIRRIKWIKILTLWNLYPSAAPDALVLEEVLQQRRHQDLRMEQALTLPRRIDSLEQGAR